MHRESGVASGGRHGVWGGRVGRWAEVGTKKISVKLIYEAQRCSNM
jgi:hypothetical protein